MHTILVILGGLVLLGLTILLARASRFSLRGLFPWFLAVWFLCAAFNLWFGVHNAGYTFMEELPIFFVVFGVPALLACLVRFKMTS